ncbi:hypothetical protein AGMMS49525_14820 [Bacteroidia bacterium]|nr:hypothetical protein AGMMS49525_14820 [Bacteroidia bacterium]
MVTQEEKNRKNDIMQKKNAEIKEHTIFICHSEKDKEIAGAFYDMLNMILCHRNIEYKLFCSSKEGEGGIESGEDVYKAITENIDKSDNIFCLLTNNSYKSAWTLFEIGYTKASKAKQLVPIAINIDYNKKLKDKPYSYFSIKQCNKNNIVQIIEKLLRNILVEEIAHKETFKIAINDDVDKFLKIVEENP